MKKYEDKPETVELLNAYLDGELSAGQADKVERLLAKDAGARRLLGELRRVREMVGGLPRVKVSIDLAEAVHEECAREMLLAREDSVTERAGKKHLLWRRIMATAAMVMLVAGAGIMVYRVLWESPGAPMKTTENELGRGRIALNADKDEKPLLVAETKPKARLAEEWAEKGSGIEAKSAAGGTGSFSTNGPAGGEKVLAAQAEGKKTPEAVPSAPGKPLRPMMMAGDRSGDRSRGAGAERVALRNAADERRFRAAGTEDETGSHLRASMPEETPLMTYWGESGPTTEGATATVQVSSVELEVYSVSVSFSRVQLENTLAKKQIGQLVQNRLEGGGQQYAFVCTTEQFGEVFREVHRYRDHRVTLVVRDEKEGEQVEVEGVTERQAVRVAQHQQRQGQIAEAMRANLENRVRREVYASDTAADANVIDKKVRDWLKDWVATGESRGSSLGHLKPLGNIELALPCANCPEEEMGIGDGNKILWRRMDPNQAEMVARRLRKAEAMRWETVGKGAHSKLVEMVGVVLNVRPEVTEKSGGRLGRD